MLTRNMDRMKDRQGDSYPHKTLFVGI